MNNESFEKWCSENRDITDNDYLGTKQKLRHAYEAGQRTLPPDVEAVIAAVDKLHQSGSSNLTNVGILFDAFCNLDQGRK